MKIIKHVLFLTRIIACSFEVRSETQIEIISKEFYFRTILKKKDTHFAWNDPFAGK